MALSLTITAILAIILGLAVLLSPRILRWAVGIWLVVYGILQFI